MLGFNFYTCLSSVFVNKQQYFLVSCTEETQETKMRIVQYNNTHSGIQGTRRFGALLALEASRHSYDSIRFHHIKNTSS